MLKFLDNNIYLKSLSLFIFINLTQTLQEGLFIAISFLIVFMINDLLTPLLKDHIAINIRYFLFLMFNTLLVIFINIIFNNLFSHSFEHFYWIMPLIVLIPLNFYEENIQNKKEKWLCFSPLYLEFYFIIIIISFFNELLGQSSILNYKLNIISIRLFQFPTGSLFLLAIYYLIKNIFKEKKEAH